MVTLVAANNRSCNLWYFTNVTEFTFQLTSRLISNGLLRVTKRVDVFDLIGNTES